MARSPDTKKVDSRQPGGAPAEAKVSSAIFVSKELDDYGLEVAEFRVYAAIARRGQCWESALSIAKRCKVSERMVRLAMKLLVRANLIEELRQPGKTTLRQVTPKERWIRPAELAGLRADIKSRWAKRRNESQTHSAPDGTPAKPDTPAPGAALHVVQPTPAASAGDPCHVVQPTPAPGAAKGTPIRYSHEGTPNAAASPSAPRRREDDPLVAAFRSAFTARYELDYQHKSADFVRLAQLRTQIESLEEWQMSLRNYFATPQASHTLADLCGRYPTFRLYRLDRFKQPVTKEDHEKPINGDRRETASERNTRLRLRSFQLLSQPNELGENVCNTERKTATDRGTD